jgi:hypothetical protein
MPIPTFDSIVQEYNLTVLNNEQRYALMQTIHSYMASCGKFAFNDQYVMVWGGNLNYYAGLEYSSSKIVMQTPQFTLWEMDGDEDNLYRIVKSAKHIVESVAA